jgi:hypothetical protein
LLFTASAIDGRGLETGKGSDALDRRPQLKAALKAAEKAKCEVAVPSWIVCHATSPSSPD